MWSLFLGYNDIPITLTKHKIWRYQFLLELIEYEIIKIVLDRSYHKYKEIYTKNAEEKVFKKHIKKSMMLVRVEKIDHSNKSKQIVRVIKFYICYDIYFYVNVNIKMTKNYKITLTWKKWTKWSHLNKKRKEKKFRRPRTVTINVISFWGKNLFCVRFLFCT